MAYEKAEWRPITGLGKLVAAGEIKNIDQVLESGRPIKEPEIVDMFLPDLEDEVLDIAMMQRMTDSGRRVQFRAVVIVGNRTTVFCSLPKTKGWQDRLLPADPACCRRCAAYGCAQDKPAYHCAAGHR